MWKWWWNQIVFLCNSNILSFYRSLSNASLESNYNRSNNDSRSNNYSRSNYESRSNNNSRSISMSSMSSTSTTSGAAPPPPPPPPPPPSSSSSSMSSNRHSTPPTADRRVESNPEPKVRQSVCLCDHWPLSPFLCSSLHQINVGLKLDPHLIDETWPRAANVLLMLTFIFKHYNNRHVSVFSPRGWSNDTQHSLLMMWQHLHICPAGAVWQGAVLYDTTAFFLVDAGRELQLLMV